MPTSMPSRLHEQLSEMHALRHEVHSRLHLAGLEEVLQWQDIEAESIELESSPTSDIVERKLSALVERLAKLLASISDGNPDSKSMFIAAVKPAHTPERVASGTSPSGREG
ncbi:hypothetical protein LVJ94_05210 [Pendulispora rubella]|uniref:Uncharacterized protein n=1 Tax=Pendulispora rubella TaxID=2741070 RepID=A0ABZ2L6R9_9BACT